MNHQNANDGRKVEMLFGQLQCRPQMKPRARVTCGKPTSLAPGVGLAQFSKCTVHTSALHLAGSPTGDSYAFRTTQTACMRTIVARAYGLRQLAHVPGDNL